MTLYAITLNWNRPDDTIDCLRSLQAQTYTDLNLVVVDNGSTDDSLVRIHTAVPQAHLIPNGRNAGFAGGMNTGLRYALQQGAEYIFILNNDTYLDASAVAEMMHHTTPNVGLIAPIIYYADAPQQVWSLGTDIHPLTLESINSRRGQTDDGQWTAVLPIDFVPGCGMLLTRQAIEEVGLFDEGFFMYYEDSDLCLRLKRAGWQLQSITTAKMWHKVSLSSGGEDSPNERYWMARSSIRFFAKHARYWQLPIIIGWRKASAIRTTLRLLRHGKLTALTAYWRGLRDGFKDRLIT